MQIRKSHRWLRIGVLVLAAQAATVGLWALFWPESFFRDFPGFGRVWVGALGPYNEHLVRDVGGLYVAWMVLFLWVAVTLDRVLLRAVMVGWLPFAVAHLVFHLTEVGRLSGSDQILSISALAFFVVLPLVILSSGRRRRTSDFGRSRKV
jgi:hypothetical protein